MKAMCGARARRTAAAAAWVVAGLLCAAVEASEGPPAEPALDSKGRAALRTLVEEYFGSADPAARAGVLERIAACDPIPKSAVSDIQKRAFKEAWSGPRLDLKHECSLETSQGTGRILVSGVKRGRLQPLLIGLHGGGAGAGDGATSEQKWQAAASKGCICVFPTVLQKTDSAWNTEREETWVLEVLEAVKRSTGVDTNRIYLVGHSMGGFGTWSIGGHYADLFAALSPNAGGVFLVLGGAEPRAAPGILPNLHNTPVRFFHSTDDAQVGPKADQVAYAVLQRLREERPDGYEHVYKEYTDIGHGMPPDGAGPILDWVLARRRDPYPATVVFEPARAAKRLFAWVEVPAGSRVSLIAATCDVKANAVTVTTRGAEGGFALYFCPGKMVDPRREVAVTVNGKERFRGYLQHSAAALVRSVAEFRDPARVYSLRLAIE